MKTFCFVFLCAIAGWWHLYSEMPPPATQTEVAQKGKSEEENLRWIDVQVVDRRTNEIIPNLTEKDFTLYEQNVAVPIATLKFESRPLSLLFLVDPSNSEYGINFRKEMTQIVNDVLDTELTEKDEVATMLIAPQQTSVVSPFGGINQLSGIPDLTSGSAEGAYYDAALHSAIKYLGQTARPQTRKVILFYAIFSTRKKTPGMEAQSIIADALKTNVTINWLGCHGCAGWGLGWLRPKRQSGNLSKNFRFDQIDPRDLTAVTGGEIINRGLTYQREGPDLQQLLKRLRTHYRLGFTAISKELANHPTLLRVELAPHLKDKKNQWLVHATRGYLPPPKPIAK